MAGPISDRSQPGGVASGAAGNSSRGGPGGPPGSWQGAGQGGRGGGGFGPGGAGEEPRDFNQMLDRTPVLALNELKQGDALIVVSTQGTIASEVTAIVLLAGVEPILAARPKGSKDVNLGQWKMSMGGGDAGP